jgi:hypothetical protein
MRKMPSEENCADCAVFPEKECVDDNVIPLSSLTNGIKSVWTFPMTYAIRLSYENARWKKAQPEDTGRNSYPCRTTGPGWRKPRKSHKGKAGSHLDL